MILNGNQRGGGLKLANHLSNEIENDHIEVHELRGFMADDLAGAFLETEAIAKGTKCQQMFFALSVSPPETEDVPIKDIEAAIDQIEEKLDLVGQPRAIVFHEKEGRRHAHAIWSRIDVQQMKAINLPHYKLKLKTISRELFLEHNWRLPDGLRDRKNRNPLNFSLAEWQQAKRAKQDPRRLKVMFKECWAVSDNRVAFERALEEKGYYLAKGDRRGFVAVDYRGEVYSLSKWTGQKKKALTEKLGSYAKLPSVDETKAMIAASMTDKLRDFVKRTEARAKAEAEELAIKKLELRTRQRVAREKQKLKIKKRRETETIARSARFRKGVKGLWDFVSGKNRKTKKQNEVEAIAAAKRDAMEREAQISKQLQERQLLQKGLRDLKREAAKEMENLHQDLSRYRGFGAATATEFSTRDSKKLRIDENNALDR